MPAKAGIQYAGAFRFYRKPREYWVPAFAGTTNSVTSSHDYFG